MNVPATFLTVTFGVLTSLPLMGQTAYKFDPFFQQPTKGFAYPEIEPVPESRDHFVVYRRIKDGDTTTISFLVGNSSDQTVHVERVYEMGMSKANKAGRVTMVVNVKENVAEITNPGEEPREIKDPKQAADIGRIILKEVFTPRKKEKAMPGRRI